MKEMHKIERSGELVLQHGRSESQQPLVRGKKLTIINDDDDDDDCVAHVHRKDMQSTMMSGYNNLYYSKRKILCIS